MPSAGETALENKVLRPRYLPAGQLLCYHFHWKCLISSVLIAACAAHVTYCQVQHTDPDNNKYSSSPSSGPCSNGYNLIPMALGALFYLLYLSECWHYRVRLGILPHRNVDQVLATVVAMRAAIPVVWWKSLCYHYLRRTRHVTRYRNGDAVTATQVYYERVNSHSSGNVFLYDQCGYKDISKKLADLDKFPIIRMRFSKGFVFACLQAANEFEEQRTRFFSENEMQDDYMEVREGLDLANLPFTERVLVFRSVPGHGRVAKLASCLFPRRRRYSAVDGENDGVAESLRVPWWMCPWVYWPASLVLLSWPLRVIAECRTAHLHFQVTKLFGTNYLSPSSVNYTGPLTRTSTMDSRELEEANRQNYLIVPSYSQAILLDPLDPGRDYAEPTTNLFRQIFSSPRRNARNLQNGGTSSYPENRMVGNQSSYGTIVGRVGFAKKAERRNVPQPNQPPRSQSISFFSEMVNKPTTRPNHLPRLFPRSGVRLPPRSMTISEGINLTQMGSIAENDDDDGLQNIEEGEEINIGTEERRERRHRQRREPGSEREPLLEREQNQLEMMHTFSIRQMPPPDEPPPPYEIALRYCSPIYQRLRQSVHSLSSSLFSRDSSSRDLRHYAMDGPTVASSSQQQ